MNELHTTSESSLLIDSNKDKHFTLQLRKVSASFYSSPKTRQQVATETGVRIQNVCRHVAKLRDYDTIKVLRVGICPITKQSGVEFLTTNSKLFPKCSTSKTDMSFGK